MIIHLPARNALMVLLEEVHINLIGPWTFQFSSGKELVLKTLACIKAVMNVVEIILIWTKTTKHVSEKFENVWLSQCPKPCKCVFDNAMAMQWRRVCRTRLPCYVTKE